MKTNELQSILNSIIENTFKVLKTVYNSQKDGQNEESKAEKIESRIFFPKKRDDTVRISEQELRFVFVEQFLQTPETKTWHYSVETPTHYKYISAREKNEPGITDQRGKKSGKTDLTVYDNTGTPVAFFEFKAGRLSPNDDKKVFNREFKYDVIKLVADSQYAESQYNNNCLGYSLHLIEKDDDKIKNFDEYIEVVHSDYSQKLDLLSADELKEKIKYMSCKLNEL